MFGNTNTPWGGNPFQNQNLDQLQNQYQQQLDTLNRMRAAQTDVLSEINKELASLDKEELGMLYESHEYMMSKNLYESAFLQFISNKFSSEFVGSPEGKEAAINLLKVIKNSKDKIAYQTKVKNDKINRVLEMLENDPEMRKRYDELTTGISPKENSSSGTKKTKQQ
jgi:hypothetical protein